MLLKRILKLYPPAWRRRYEEEMLALLEQHRVTWQTLLDLLRGALDARLDPHFRTPPGLLPEEKIRLLRCAHSTICWAFPLLVLGHLFFLDELDDAFYPWNRTHALLWELKTIANTMTGLGFFACLLTGLALACILAKRASKTGAIEKRQWLLGGSAAAIAVYGLGSSLPASGCILFLAGLAVGPLALSFAFARYEIPQKFLCYALIPAALTILGMVAQLVFVAVWGCAIWKLSAPTVQQMAQAAERHIWPDSLWHLQLLGGIFWMTLLTGCTLWRYGRGLNGLFRKEAPETDAS